MLYYHATSIENAKKILDSWKIQSPAGINYFCLKPEECLRFIYVHQRNVDCVIFEVDIHDEVQMEESFDHSETFFKCKAYCCCEAVSASLITNIMLYGRTIEHKEELADFI